MTLHTCAYLILLGCPDTDLPLPPNILGYFNEEKIKVEKNRWIFGSPAKF